MATVPDHLAFGIRKNDAGLGYGIPLYPSQDALKVDKSAVYVEIENVAYGTTISKENIESLIVFVP